MVNPRSNVFVEAINGMTQHAKPTARGFRTLANFSAIADLRLCKLTHLPISLFVSALPLSAGITSLRV